jgi:hypothetical protein
MRGHCAALLLLASVSACAMPQTPSYLRSETAPLRAELFRGAGPTVGFHINRPAHVAVFEVDPGMGARMIHPRLGSDQYMPYAGSHAVWRSESSPLHRQRHRTMFTALGSGYGNWYGAGALQPRVYLLIASERPLRVDEYRHSPLGLQIAMRNTWFGRSPYSMLDDLAELVVPDPHASDWVSDVYVEWPSSPMYDAMPVQTHVVGCRDGSVMVLPVYVLACPQDAPRPAVRDTSVLADRAAPQQPDRRRPERGGRGEGGQPGSAWTGEPTGDGTPVRPGRASRPERASPAPRAGERPAPSAGEGDGGDTRAGRARPARGSGAEGARSGSGAESPAPRARPAEPSPQPARQPEARPASPPAAAPRPAPPTRPAPETRAEPREQREH